MHDDMINDVLHSQKSQREGESKREKTSCKKNYSKAEISKFHQFTCSTFDWMNSENIYRPLFLLYGFVFLSSSLYKHEFRCRENGTRRKNSGTLTLNLSKQKKIHGKKAIQLNENKNGINLNFWLNILAFYWNVAKQTIF